MDKIDISIATKNKIAGKVSTKKKIDANIYPRGPKGEQGLQGLKGEKGDDGNGIVNIKKAKTEGLIDTYTILFSNGLTFDFTVTNANTEDIYSKEEIEELLNKKVNILDIVNELTSDDANKILSAKQGKILKELIDSCYTSTETDNLLKSKANKEELNQLQSNIETAIGELSEILDIQEIPLTINDEYVYSDDFTVYCYKIGKLVIIEFGAIAFKSVPPNYTTIISGVPQAVSTTIFSLFGNNGAKGDAVRLRISSNNVITHWGSPSHYSDSANKQYSGVVMYKTNQ